MISPILASKMGFGQPAGRTPARASAPSTRTPARWSPRSSRPTRTPSSGSSPRNLARGSRGFCQFQTGFQRDFGLAAIALADTPKPEAPKTDKDKDKDKDEAKKPEPRSPSFPRSSSARRSSTS